MTGDLPMGAHKITGLANGVADSDAATVGQLSTAVDVLAAYNSAPTKDTPVDADRLLMSDSADSYALKKFTWANLKTALSSLFALQTTTISAAGLVTGGGSLSTNRTLTVTAASQAQAETGTDIATVLTPLGGKQAFDAHHLDNIYTGSSAANINFPVGTYLFINYTSTVPNRNDVVVVRVGSDSLGYNEGGTGTILTGTWRSRGTEQVTAYFGLVQRVA